MENKLKVNLYVRGDIIADKYTATCEIEAMTPTKPEAEVDLSNAVVIDGPMHVGSLAIYPGARVAASGYISSYGRRIYKERSEE